MGHLLCLKVTTVAVLAEVMGPKRREVHHSGLFRGSAPIFAASFANRQSSVLCVVCIIQCSYVHAFGHVARLDLPLLLFLSGRGTLVGAGVFF